ncbi:MAG TPA: DUF255 domain-containing protein [Spirochaetes bacterium]|nr:DUF255 domain-containing protein [Spirochaetota bacterium]
MKRTLLSVALSAMVLFLFCGKEASTGHGLTWYDFQTGMKKAKELKRPVVIDFYASWCSWCAVMERETFGHEEVARRLKNDYVTIRVDVEKGANITMGGSVINPQQFAAMMGVKGLPSVAFMDRDGGLITMIPGYIKADTFLPLLDYIKSECYLRKVSFQDYVKKGDCGK